MALPDYPITRNEQYLNNIATGSGELPEFPLSREEQYLAYIAEHGGGGGGNVPDPTVSDIGKVVGAVADGTGAKLAYVEGGGGSGLPPVTGSGKALVSVDGEWVEQSGYPYEDGGGTVIVDNETVSAETENPPFGYAGYFTTEAQLVIGTEYSVIFDGNKYTDIARDYEHQGVILGAELPDYSRFPFAVVNIDNFLALGVPQSGTHTVTISVESIHTIDPKYLPSTIPTTEDVQYMIETAIGDAIAAIPTKAMVVTYDDDTTETFNVLIEATE